MTIETSWTTTKLRPTFDVAALPQRGSVHHEVVSGMAHFFIDVAGVLSSRMREPADRGLPRDGRRRAICPVEPPAWTPKIGPRKAGCCRLLRPRSFPAGESWSCLGRGAFVEEIARGSGRHVTNSSRSGVACVKRLSIGTGASASPAVRPSRSVQLAPPAVQRRYE